MTDAPAPRGAQGRAVAWKQTALAAHTQTFVTISRTFFPCSSSSLLAGAKPGAQVRNCSHRSRRAALSPGRGGPGSWGREACRRDTGLRGWPSWAGKTLPLEHFSHRLYLFPASLMKNEPESFFPLAQSDASAGTARGPEGLGVAARRGQVRRPAQHAGTNCAGGPERGLTQPGGTGWGRGHAPAGRLEAGVSLLLSVPRFLPR